MKILKSFLITMLLVIILPIPETQALSTKIPVTYVSTTDGDTLKVKTSTTTYTLQLLLINAPELATATKPAQPYSTEAKSYLYNYLKGKKLTIAYDNQYKTDKYGKHLVYLYADGILVNNIMVKYGFARVGSIMTQQYYLNTLKASETLAKNNKLRIWSIPGYVSTTGTGFIPPTQSYKPGYPTSLYKQGAPTYLANCTEVRKYYPYGITYHHISYRSAHDRDSDKLGCEASGLSYQSWMKYN